MTNYDRLKASEKDAAELITALILSIYEQSGWTGIDQETYDAELEGILGWLREEEFNILDLN